MRPGLRGAALAAALAFALPGCGGGDSPGADTQAPAPVHTTPAGRRPALPSGWRRVVNPDAGFSFALPPGWTVRGGRTTLVRSHDRALALSVNGDYSSPGRTDAPAEYARRTLAGLQGFRGLRVGRPRPVRRAPYPAARLPATGTFRASGVRQAIDLYALQRRGVATYTLIAFRSERVPGRRYAPLVARLVRTFHSEPPMR